MSLREKIFKTPNLELTTLALVIGLGLFGLFGGKKQEGRINNTKVLYYRQPFYGRDLTIKEENGIETKIHSHILGNVIGNGEYEHVRINLPNGVLIDYYPDEVMVSGKKEIRKFYGKLEKGLDVDISTESGNKEIVHLRPTVEVFSEYTKIFNEYRTKILSKK